MGISGNKEESDRENRINERICKDSKIVKIDKDLIQVLKSICKIIIQNGDKYTIGTGFLIKLFKKNILFYYLMTNEHIITEEMVESKEEIEIYYDYENKKNLITLNKEEREINKYKNNDLDITIVQILEKDDINEFYFLLPNLDYKNLKDRNIYIPQFPEGNDLSYSKGEIIKVKKYELFHNASTKEGSSGSLIFLKNTTKVIGIHKQGDKYKEENYGNFIFPIIYMLNEKNIYFDDQYEGELLMINLKEKENMFMMMENII